MERDTVPPENARSGAILNKTYGKYMIPAILSAVGVSLGEFADSLIVGQLLDANAFAIVNLGAPVVFLACMVFSVTGLGGSLLYAERLGRKEKEQADETFTVSAGLSLMAGILLLLLLLAGHGWLGSCSAARTACGKILTAMSVY